jgi:hypothetical protein
LRKQLYEEGTRSLEAILRAHLPSTEVGPSLVFLTGAVLVKVAFEGTQATNGFIEDLVDRVLASSDQHDVP